MSPLAPPLRIRRPVPWIAAVAFGLLVTVSEARADGPCERAAAEAERTFGIPAGLLSALAQAESWRQGRAWPWTLNLDGKARFYADKGAAIGALEDFLADGGRNADAGCMQINLQ